MAKAQWKPKLKSGVPYDEVISGLQKMIRRGKVREALVFAQEMFDSGFHSAVARRLMVISAEDIGLANPEVVSQVYTFCTGYLVAKKDSPSGRVEPLALYLAIILMASSPKNRESDDAQIVTIARMKAGKDSAAKIIKENEALVVDQHTQRGRSRLECQAATVYESYEQVAMREFLTVGTQLIPHVRINGDLWGREAREIYGVEPERFNNDSDGSEQEA